MDLGASPPPPRAAPTGLLYCLFLRLMEMVFVASRGEIVHYEGEAWVSLRTITSMMVRRYSQYRQEVVLAKWFDNELLQYAGDGKYKLAHHFDVHHGGYFVRLSRGLLKTVDGKTEIFDTVANKLLKVILEQNTTPVDENCVLRKREDQLVYKPVPKEDRTKGLYFLQLAPLLNFTRERGHFICGKVGMSLALGERIYTESLTSGLGKFGRVECRFYLPFKDSTPEDVLEGAEKRLLFHLFRMGLSFVFRTEEEFYPEMVLYHPSHFGLIRECFYFVAEEFNDHISRQLP